MQSQISKIFRKLWASQGTDSFVKILELQILVF